VIRAGYGIYSVREDIGAVDNLSFSAPIYPVLVTGNVQALPLADSKLDAPTKRSIGVSRIILVT